MARESPMDPGITTSFDVPGINLLRNREVLSSF
jgi:hypothetical protein